MNNATIEDDLVKQIDSEDGRYTIFHKSSRTGYAQIFEYAGSAPRMVVRSFELPMAFLAGFVASAFTPVAA
jgi:hypothetical protein